MTFANEGDKPSDVTAARDTNNTWAPGERPDIREAEIGEGDITTGHHHGRLGNDVKPKSPKHQGKPPKKPRDHTEINFKSWSLKDLLGRRSTEEQELPELPESPGIIPGDDDDGDGSSTTTVSSTPSKEKKPKPWKVRGSPRNQSGESKLSNENSGSTEYRSWSLKGLLASRKSSGEQGEGIEPAVGVGGGSSTSNTPTGRKLRNGNVAGSNTSSPLRIGSPIFLPGKSFLTPSATFARFREEKDEMSRMTPSPKEWSLREGVTLPMIGQVKWETLKKETIKWLLNPKNFALLVWMIAVVVAGAILFMVMVGMLNAAIPKKSDRDTYFEVSNQILNALFVLMALYTHPLRILHLIWLIRWNSTDILKLRALYCKGGLRKPHEWSHMLVVVMLLQLNCFATYALAGLNWGYRRANRPAIGVGITLAVAFGAGATAGIYNSLSPLGKDFELEHEDDDIDVRLDGEEKGLHAEGGHGGPNLFKLHKRNYNLLEKRMSFSCRAGRPVANPQWEGGLFACHEEPTISILSTACFCCVMGWNLERLGFGNRFVHIVTFLLLLGAPYLVFDLAAINVNNRYVRTSLGVTGAVLCVFSLLYGGFWRIKMRERYNLPARSWCCGQPNVSDCFQWLFCAPCSLCQEVRTAEAYDIRDDKFYCKPPTRTNTPGSSPPNYYSSSSGGGEINLMVAPSTAIPHLPNSTMVPIKNGELIPGDQIPTDLTILFPPPTQTVKSTMDLEAFERSPGRL